MRRQANEEHYGLPAPRPSPRGHVGRARTSIREGGPVNTALAIGAPMIVFGFGSALLSHNHYAIRRGWPTGRFFSSSDCPMVLALVLIGFSLFITIWHFGWIYLPSTVVGGLIFSFVFMNSFCMWSQTALILGPLAAVISINPVGARLNSRSES
jgi:hypothetical protein